MVETSPTNTNEPESSGARRDPTAMSLASNTRNDRVFAWLGMALVLVVAVAAILPDLMTMDPILETESEHVVTAVETRDRLLRVIGESSWLEPIAPHQYGVAIRDTPPGMTWVQLPAMMLVQPKSQTQATAGLATQYLRASRLTQLGFALMFLASIFWAGYGIGGIKTGLFSTLIALATPALLLSARVAIPALPAASWLALSMAAAIWALRPMRPGPAIVRQISGWLISGIALAALFATAGWFGLLMAMGPMLGIVLLCPRRFSHLMAMVSSLCVAALLLSPWLWHVAGEPWEQSTYVTGHWLLQLWPGGWVGWDQAWRLPWLRLFWVAIIALPWTIWLIGALMQPFSSSSRSVRSRMLIGWLWFVISVSLVFLFGPSQSHMTLTLLVLPGMAVMLGQMFRQYSDLSAEGRHANLWQGLKWPFMVCVGFLSVALPLMIYFQHGLIREGWVDGPFASSVPGWWLVGVVTVLGATAALAIRYAVVHRPGRTVALSALWSVLAVTLVMMPIYRGPLGTSPLQADAQNILKTINGSSLYYWSESMTDVNGQTAIPTHMPQSRLVVLLGRVVLPLHLEQVQAMSMDQTIEAKHRVTYVLIHGTQGFPQEIQELGTLVMLAKDGWRLCALELNPVPGDVEPKPQEPQDR